MRLNEAIPAYLDSLLAEGRSPRTVSAYRRDLAKLAGHLGGEMNVGEVTPTHLLAFASSAGVLNTDHGSPRAQAGINRIRTATRGVFAFLVRAWVITANPAKVLRIKKSEAPRMALLSRDDEERLLATIEADDSWAARRDALIVRLLLATGIRLSSLVGIDARDIDLDHGRLTVSVKGGRVQDVALEPELGAALLEHTRGQPGPVFRSARGGGLGKRQVQLRFAMWREKAGVEEEVTIHGLRHTFGTRLYRRTRDLRRVQVALGHRSVETSVRYVAAGA